MTNNTVIYLGNYYGYNGRSFDGQVFHKEGLSPPILACSCNGNVPKIIVENKDVKNNKIR